jgi:hypothetical protein
MKTLNDLMATGTSEELIQYINERETSHRALMKELRCLAKIRTAMECDSEQDTDVAAS